MKSAGTELEVTTIDELQAAVRAFTDEREWGQFHTPKNLIMALTGELGELAEIFQWLTPEQADQLDPQQRKQTSDELADVFIYLLRLADVLDIDLAHAVRSKLASNASKYPVDQARGNATKYTELRTSSGTD
ncbi:nucleotide pyrophosphohydrolase [Rhodococcus sp. 105337]|nr:nucleotide pyrophosphohydrolase [Rhodococcus sp. 105337]